MIIVWLKKHVDDTADIYSIFNTGEQMKKRILFIINPVSGIGKKKILEGLINAHIDPALFDFEILYTQYGGHAAEISKKASRKYDAVCAIGGDGTVNEVASGLRGGTAALAIIPAGSGNGLARHLKIPMNTKKAVRVINLFRIRKIDTISANGKQCVNVCGVGFDGHISHLYAGIKKRGFLSYVKLSFRELIGYVPQEYTVKINGKTYKRRSFFISFANSSQFGNEVVISPDSRVDDGVFEVCLASPFSLFAIPYIAVMVFSRRINRTKYVEIISGKKAEIVHDSDMYGHIDGDPADFGKRLKIEINPGSLEVVC